MSHVFKCKFLVNMSNQIRINRKPFGTSLDCSSGCPEPHISSLCSVFKLDVNFHNAVIWQMFLILFLGVAWDTLWNDFLKPVNMLDMQVKLSSKKERKNLVNLTKSCWRMSNCYSIYLNNDDDDNDDDREINNVTTVNSVPCTGHHAKHFTYLITFSFHTTLKDRNHCFILQIRKLRFRKATQFVQYHTDREWLTKMKFRLPWPQSPNSVLLLYV